MINTFVAFERWIVMNDLWFRYRDKLELVNEWTFWLCNMTLISQSTRIGSKITNPNYDQALLSQAPKTQSPGLPLMKFLVNPHLHRKICIIIAIIQRSYFASSSFSGLNVMVKSSNQIKWVSYVSFWLECHGCIKRPNWTSFVGNLSSNYESILCLVWWLHASGKKHFLIFCISFWHLLVFVA